MSCSTTVDKIIILPPFITTSKKLLLIYFLLHFLKSFAKFILNLINMLIVKHGIIAFKYRYYQPL